MWKRWLSEERVDSMIGVALGTREDAQSAAEAVRAERGLESTALRVIEPGRVDRRYHRVRRGGGPAGRRPVYLAARS